MKSWHGSRLREPSRPTGWTIPCCSKRSRRRKHLRHRDHKSPPKPRSRISEGTMFGKLSWSAIPVDQPIPLMAAGAVLIVILAVLVWATLKGYMPYVWREWITSVDHKRIGIMYSLLAMV